jgi:hypothetical protein
MVVKTAKARQTTHKAKGAGVALSASFSILTGDRCIMIHDTMIRDTPGPHHRQDRRQGTGDDVSSKLTTFLKISHKLTKTPVSSACKLSQLRLLVYSVQCTV